MYLKKLHLIFFSFLLISFNQAFANIDNSKSKDTFISNNIEYVEKELEINIKDGKILGTLNLPNNFTNGTIALIVPGSGSINRDGNDLKINLNTNSYKYISQELAKDKIASFRFDKRYLHPEKINNFNLSNITLEDGINDLISIIKFFKNDKRFNKIILLGHSEGSLISIISAEKEKVNGFVSIAGLGKEAGEVLLEQLKKPNIDQEELNYIIKNLKEGKLVNDIKDPTLKFVFATKSQNYLISWLKYSPAKEIKNLNCDIQIIQGTTDLQVSVANAIELNSSNKNSKIEIIENMNHILKDAPIDVSENLKTYINPNLPLNKKIMPLIIKFINNIK
ncbi:MAG: alpha/beta hydrolase [Candidatus Sericytochromatia bacterium]